MIGVNVSAKTDTNASEALIDGLNQALLEAADDGYVKSQDLVGANSTDEGTLLKSGVQPKLKSDGTIEWGYVAPHAKYVEFGTAPHWPPIEPLKDWARRVLGDESAAYAVQKKIAAEGTDPSPFFRPGVEEMRRRLRAQNVGTYVEDNL